MSGAAPEGADPFSVAGRHAWVVGATGGIGRASAVALARAGARVHLVGRSADRLAEVASAMAEAGLSADVHPCDIADTDAVRGMFEGAPVEVVVNAAGLNIPQLVEEVRPEDFDTVFDVNVRSTFFVAQEAVRAMRSGGTRGSIILVTSQMGHVGGLKRTVYCGSKWAVEGMVRALGAELAPEGIRVNTVAPTFVDTPMTHASLAEPSFHDFVMGHIPMGKLAQPEDVAAAVVFLAGPGSGMITGTSIVIDGGWTAV